MTLAALCVAAAALGASAYGIGPEREFAVRLNAGRADIMEQAKRAELARLGTWMLGIRGDLLKEEKVILRLASFSKGKPAPVLWASPRMIREMYELRVRLEDYGAYVRIVDSRLKTALERGRTDGTLPEEAVGLQDTATRLLAAGRSLRVAASLLGRESPLAEAKRLLAKANLLEESAEALLRTTGAAP